MLLFPQKAEINVDHDGKQFYVISPRPDVNEQLCAQFRLAGFNSVKGIELNITELDELTIPANAGGVVVDIGSNTQVDSICDVLQVKIPRQVWSCVVGDSDSISLSQYFMRNNIHYFNINVQQNMIVHTAVLGVDAKEKRRAVSISVLSCKGGTGSTTIGYQLAGKIAELKKVPTLFIQGANGTRDLDLFAGKKLTQNITSQQKCFDLMSGESTHFPDLDQQALQNYNVVLFEQAINTADKELVHHFIERSLCLVLIIDRSMASIRVARNVIESVDLLQRTSLVMRRLFICLSDTRPVQMHMLSLEDIQSLLGRQVDVQFPYNKQGKPEIHAFSRFTHVHSPLDVLTHGVLGNTLRQPTSLVRRILRRKGKGS